MRAQTMANGRTIKRLRRGAYAVGLALLAALGLALAGAPPADAATLTVTGPQHEAVTNGSCSLAEAISNVNAGAQAWADCVATGAYGSNDTIVFNISTVTWAAECPGGVCTFPAAFYEITRPVTIDGYTQPGASPNTQAIGSNAVLKIHVTRAGNWQGEGLVVRSSNVTIRGLAITGFQAAGVKIQPGAANVTIAGNHIGVDPSGTAAAGNNVGIHGDSVDSNVVIGGTTPEARNVISGNRSFGVWLVRSRRGTRVLGNYIGTNAAGADKVGNAWGVVLDASAGVVVGGTTPEARNVISGNADGIRIGSGTEQTVVQGNFIGTDATGTLDRGNFWGIVIDPRIGRRPTNNVIGGTESGAGNLIAFNSMDGVNVWTGEGNAILGNRIFGNRGLGIDLGITRGVTPNDPHDTDEGENRLQNFPVLASAAVGTGVGVAGKLNSTPSSSFRVELFANATCDPSGHGQGESLLHVVTVTTNAEGNAEFLVAVPPVALGRQITATATGLTTNDTSEFSNCVAVEEIGGVSVTPTSGLVTREDGRLAVFSIRLDSAPRADVTIGLSSSNPAEGTVTPATLTFTPANATVSQTVFVTGVDDAVHDGDVAYTIVTAPARSADPAYQGLDPPDIAAVNRDDDPAPQPPAPPSAPPAAPPLPTLTIADGRRVEGNAGVANLLFTVRLSAPSRVPVRVAFATQDLPPGPLAARAGRDYVPRRDTLIIPPGRTVDTIAIRIRGDALLEPDERFRLLLSGPSGATLVRPTALGLILDNDGAPRLYVDDAERAEGQAGRAPLAFTVGLTRPSPVPVTVRFATASGTARAGADFAAVGGTLTFPPGAVKRTVLVPVVGDRVREPDEQLRLVLSRASVGLADPVGVGTIRNDD